MTPAHIVIIGADLIGCSTAYYLTRHGRLAEGSTVTLVAEGDVGSGEHGAGLIQDGDAEEDEAKDEVALRSLGWQLHHRLAEENAGGSGWGYRPTKVHRAQLDAGGSNSSDWASDVQSDGFPRSTFPGLSPVQRDKLSNPSGPVTDSARAAILDAVALTRHLCSRFLAHPKGVLMVARGKSLTVAGSNGPLRSGMEVHSELENQVDRHAESSLAGGSPTPDSPVNPGKTSSGSLPARTSSAEPARGRHRITGVGVVQVINGVEETIHIPADLVLIAKGALTPELLDTLPARAGAVRKLGIRQTRIEGVELKVREKLAPMALRVSVHGGGGEAQDKQLTVLCQGRGIVHVSGEAPSQSAGQDPSPSEASTRFTLTVQSLSPAFEPSHGALTISQDAWSVPSLPDRRTLLGYLRGTDDESTVEGLMIGLSHGNCVTSTPAIGSLLSDLITGAKPPIDVEQFAPPSS
ncbi:hypothetical protein IAU60_006314 [Kwoniella sp. DSM 27419]